MSQSSKFIFMYGLLGLVGLIVLFLSTTAFVQAAYPSYQYESRTNDSDSVFQDGRINSDDSPVVIYETETHPIQIYSVNPENSEGAPALEITQEEIDAAGIPDVGYVIIAQTVNPWTGYPIIVYRLSTGEFQMNSYDQYGNLVEYIWS